MTCSMCGSEGWDCECKLNQGTPADEIAMLRDEIADLKTELREAGEIIAECIRESGQAEERGARKMAQVVCDECKRCQDAGEAQAISLEELVQLWREGRGK